MTSATELAWQRWQAMTPAERQKIIDHPGFKIKPLARGKQLDSFALSDQGLATGHFWEGAVRSSKTIVSILRWIRFIRSGPPGNLAMIGKTERTLKRNVIDIMTALLGPKAVKLRTGSGELEICGRLVYIAGANNALAVAKIQGMTLVGWYGDEIPTWPDEVFNMARTRLSDPGAEWFGTGNPAASTHNLNVNWIKRAKLHLQRDGKIVKRSMNDRDTQDIHVYSFKLRDNPFLTEKYLRITENSYTGMFYKRYILGEWCMAEGAIYDAWDPDRHVVTAAPAIERWLSVGIDHGTTNPFSAIAVGLGPAPRGLAGKALYATAEYRYESAKTLRRMTDLEYADALRAWLPQRAEMPDGDPELVAVDPSAPGFRQQLFRYGIPSKAADNDVLPGIRTLSSVIGRDRFYAVRSGCPSLIEELPDYAWDDKAAAIGQDKPIKVNDHSCDAVRYGTQTGRQSWWYDLFPEELEALLEPA